MKEGSGPVNVISVAFFIFMKYFYAITENTCKLKRNIFEKKSRGIYIL